MTVRKFAVHIGVSDRMVSHWERGGVGIVPRPSNQSALDTSLSVAGTEVQERFAVLITEQAAAAEDQRTEILLAADPLQFVRHPVDAKLMAAVPEGIYLGGDAGETTWLPSFHIDVFPTTNADYFRFVSATGHPPPQHWDGPRHPNSLFDHPVVWVTWRDAAAYAAWAGKALPTSDQWEKAARGTKGNIYPWGNSPTAAKCNVSDSGIGHTTPVSRYQSGASPFGAYDLCGNAWEWCVTESSPGRRELKGSAFTSPFVRATPSAFNDASTSMSDEDTGFRCVAEHL
ncbi:SUMF1/EgtB/PvdO family nonheme iron enzyme [Streptomyces sp. NPDC002602]|uniref:SUMF1/EgtB/PvdO family nonheme iron enzyme n=1 Tax=Streptomyces sp. NPDC002602 TaxID=3364654 RepID=UPI003699B966